MQVLTKNLTNHAYILVHIALIYDKLSRTNANCDKSSVTYVTSNLCLNQWTIHIKKGAICLVQTNMNRHIQTQLDCIIVIIINKKLYCIISIGKRNKFVQTLHSVFAGRDRLAP